MNTHIKTYPYNQSINLVTIWNLFDKFKFDVKKENKNIKFISLNINLINDTSLLCLIENLKTNILNKNHPKLTIQLRQQIKLLEKYLNEQTFEEIQFSYNTISYLDYISLEDKNKIIKKMFHKIDRDK